MIEIIDAIFVIKKPSNDIIFYGQLADEQIPDLETVLGQIIMKASTQPKGSRKQIALKQGKFLYGVFDGYYMILALSKGTSKDIADRIIRSLAKRFSERFKQELEAHNGDNTIFTAFSEDIQDVLQKFLTKPTEQKEKKKPTPIQKTEEKPTPPEKPQIEEEKKEEKLQKEEEKKKELPYSQRKGMIQIKPSQEIKDDFSFDKPLIKPQKRQAYPDGIPEYARDEVLFNESFEVQKNFETELIDYQVSKIKVKLNIALTHIYDIIIDFSNYPERPKIEMSEGLKRELGKPIEEISYFLRNWDPKIPPHITEIVYELEKILLRFKSEGKLSPTQEMPENILPELKPLEDDIPYDPNYRQEDLEVPEYDGSDMDKYLKKEEDTLIAIATGEIPAQSPPQMRQRQPNTPQITQTQQSQPTDSQKITKEKKKKKFGLKLRKKKK